MTTEELMVGDYITFSDVQNDSNCPKLKVVIIDKEDVYVSIDGDPVVDVLDPKDLAGIPLTPEILEKNGFENISTHTIKGYDTFRLDIEQRGFDYCITIKLKDYFKLQSYDDRWYTKFGCNYVHELQHALRLCGIEKEIEL